jgi:hypothetical protein
MAGRVAILTMYTLLKMAPPFQALQSVNLQKTRIQIVFMSKSTCTFILKYK